MDSMFNRGDTAYLLLNYTVNGQPLQQGAYQEIEFQINTQGNFRGIKKRLSKGQIFWGENFTYLDNDGEERTFTGYVTALSQNDTFLLAKGTCEVQLRVLLQNEVGSSETSDLDVGRVLSSEVLE